MREVSIGSPNPRARIEFTPVKSGPLTDAASSAHGTVFSDVHTSSLACAPCHEYRNPLGFAVLTTYSEWKSSPAAAEGKHCQSCHMYRVAGDVVDPRLERSSGAKVNLHQMPGSHSLEQLMRTIGASIDTERDGAVLRVSVTVTNRTAGHSVPTGSSLRELVLEVKADGYDGQHFSDRRVYRRVLGDQHGNPIDREHLAILRSAKVLSDTRLASGEKRTEVFTFPLPAGVQASVLATVSYQYAPMARPEPQKPLRFLTLRRLVK
jgi:hypothetical protein